MTFMAKISSTEGNVSQWVQMIEIYSTVCSAGSWISGYGRALRLDVASLALE